MIIFLNKIWKIKCPFGYVEMRDMVTRNEITWLPPNLNSLWIVVYRLSTPLGAMVRLVALRFFVYDKVATNHLHFAVGSTKTQYSLSVKCLHYMFECVNISIIATETNRLLILLLSIVRAHCKDQFVSSPNAHNGVPKRPHNCRQESESEGLS